MSTRRRTAAMPVVEDRRVLEAEDRLEPTWRALEAVGAEALRCATALDAAPGVSLEPLEGADALMATVQATADTVSFAATRRGA